MKQPRQSASNNGSFNNGHKETRWDRIRKRCTTGNGSGGGHNVKTETVQRFIETDYIGKRNISFLKGELEKSSLLNPALVMDMRHEMVMFQKIPHKLPLATVENQNNLQSCLTHNIAVEERFIDNELKKFRQQLEKNRNRHKVKFERKPIEKDTFYVDNKSIMKSLETSSKHINDFYAAPLDALNEFEQLADDNWNNDFPEEVNENVDLHFSEELKKNDLDFVVETFSQKHFETKVDLKDFVKNQAELLDENIKFSLDCKSQNNGGIEIKGTSAESTIRRRTPSPLTPTDEFLRPMRDAAAKHQEDIRRVRFEDEIEPHICEGRTSSCSNTSDGLDSIISDLAEEALYELQMEEHEIATNAEKKHAEEQEIPESSKQLPNTSIEKINLPTPLVIIGESAQSQNKENDLLIITQVKFPSTIADDQQPSPLSSEDEEDETTSVHEQNLIIEQLFRSRAHTNISIMRKYFLKWIHYTTITKIEREDMTNKNDRIHQINVFLDKVRKEKVRISKTSKDQIGNSQAFSNVQAPRTENIQITKKYKNKIKMQQDVIELQRLKLERQERLILELKLKKLSDEAKEARQEIKNELKAVIRSGDEKSKAKAKCLQLIGNLRDNDDEDEFKRLQGKSLLVPKFLQKMQERALERSMKHEQARQRRMQQEAEREAQKIAAEEAKRLEDEEAKRIRIEALKEKRRMEKMAKILKEREHQRMIENRRKAQEFCRRRLLSRIGMEGFKQLIERKRLYIQKSEELRRKVIKRTAFIAWRDIYIFELERRIQKAENLNSFLVQRNAFFVWRAYVAEERSKYFVAIDWYDMKLSTYMFKEWSAYTQRMKVIEKSKMRKAISHFEWNLKFKVLDCWQRLPQVLRLEKETEERRQRWRMKIWELLPDYTPRLDTFV